MLAPNVPKIISREIKESDLNSVIELLLRGYSYRPRAYWERTFGLLARHRTPAGYPKYGYLMEDKGAPVGAVVLIFAEVRSETGPVIRCSIGGWCVDPEYRSYASLLVMKSLGRKEVTYVNVPGPEIRRISEAQGFSPYARGQIAAIPLLTFRDPGATVLAGDQVPSAPFDPFDQEVLRTHAGYGCISLWCVTPERAYPFVFHPRNVKGVFPCARLVYCRSVDDLVRFARPIGRYLAARGRFVVVLDANGPMPGLVGIYFEGSRPKYFKGPSRPRVGDLAYTQLAMFET
jgi:hypothetical protein